MVRFCSETNLGTNYMLNLTHLARTINSLIGGKSLSTQTNGGLTVSLIREKKFQRREIDLDQLTYGELCSRYRFDRESIKYLVEILKVDLQRQTRRNHALLQFFAPYFLEAGGQKTR